MKKEIQELNQAITKGPDFIQSLIAPPVEDESTAVEHVDTFIERYSFLRQRIKGFRNTWDDFTSTLRCRARVMDGHPPHSFKKEEGLSTTEQLCLRTIYDVLVADNIIHTICPWLEKEGYDRLIPNFMRRVPMWLRQADGFDKPTLDILSQLGQEQRNKEMTPEIFKSVTEFLIAQQQKEYASGIGSTYNAMLAWTVLDPTMMEEFQRDYLMKPNARVSNINTLFVKIYNYVADKIVDPSDEHHNEVRAFLMKMDKDAPVPFGFSCFLESRLFGEAGNEDVQQGMLGPILMLKKYGQLTNDLWYVGLADTMIEKILSYYGKHRLLKKDQLGEHLIIPIDAKPDYTRLRTLAASMQQEDAFAYFESPEKTHLFFPNIKPSCLIHIRRQGELLGFSVNFNSSEEQDPSLEGWSEGRKRFRYAVDISEEHPNVFLQVFDPEKVGESLKAQLVLLAIAAFEERLTARGKIEEDTLQESKPITVEIARHKGLLAGSTTRKGPEKMAGSGRKRKQGRKENNSVEERGMGIFLGQVEQRRFHKPAALGKEVEASIQCEHGYSDKQMDFFRRKIIIYNAGGAVAKPLLAFNGPNNLPVIEIKATDFRILAEVCNDKIAIFDIIRRRDLT